MAMIVQDPSKWKEALKKLDAVEGEQVQNPKNVFNSIAETETPSSRGARSKLEVLDVEKWSVDNVIEWLSYIRDNDGVRMNEKFEKEFRENDIDGKALIAMNDEQLKAIGIKSLGKRLKLQKEIEKLKVKRTYSLNEHFVMSKFEKMDPKFLKSVGNVDDKVQSLCDVEEIKKTYLSPTFVDPELEKHIQEEMEEEKDGIQLAKHESSLATVLFNELRKPDQKIPVKLVVTEIVHSDKHKSIRRILSPVVSSIPSLSSDFGMFHTSLIVGPWYLEWTDSSLCIPKKISSSMALLSMDVETLSIPKQSIQVLTDRLAQVVVDWNVNKTYLNFGLTKKPNEGNCQDFIQAVLEKLEISPQFTGALAHFLNEMKIKGKCEMEFTPDAAFKQKFNLSKDKYTFATHRELDEFVHQLMVICPTFKLDHENERVLLKSFDRAFWLRHFKKPDAEQFLPGYVDLQTKEFVHKCPFDDPRDTGTMAAK
jgi:hypothetical protein